MVIVELSCNCPWVLVVTTALDIRDSRMVTAKCLILDTKSILYSVSAATTCDGTHPCIPTIILLYRTVEASDICKTPSNNHMVTPLLQHLQSLVEVQDHAANGSETKPFHLLKFTCFCFHDVSKIIS